MVVLFSDRVSDNVRWELDVAESHMVDVDVHIDSKDRWSLDIVIE